MTDLPIPPDLQTLVMELSTGGSALLGQVLKSVEATLIRTALISTNQNVTYAARRLGMKRTTLQERMKRHGISAPRIAVVEAPSV